MTAAMTLDGADELRARFRAVGKSTGDVMRRIGLGTVAEGKRRVRRKTGNLGRRISLRSFSDDHALVVAATPYAAVVERGSKAHDIVPRKKRALRFPAKGTPTTLSGRVRSSAAKRPGAYRFAKRVRHPGTKPYPYLVPGAEAAVKKVGLGEVIVTAWNKAA